MLKVYDAENQIDAQLALDALQSAEIEVVMKGQFLSGAAGELPASGLVTLWVVDPDSESKARDIIAEYESRKHLSGPPQECPGCSEMIDGNFVCCWNCGEELPEISKRF